MIDERTGEPRPHSPAKPREFDQLLDYCLSLDRELEGQVSLLEQLQSSDLLSQALEEHRADIRDFFQLDPQTPGAAPPKGSPSPRARPGLLGSNHQHFDRLNTLLSQHVSQQEDVLENMLNTSNKLEEKLSKFERMTQLFDYKKEFLDDRFQSLLRLAEEQRAEKAGLKRELDSLLQTKRDLTELEAVRLKLKELEAEERLLDLQFEQACQKNKALLAQIHQEEYCLAQQEAETSLVHCEVSKMRAEERKLIHDIQEIKGNIRVNVRIRPPIEADLAAKEDDIIELLDSKNLMLTMPNSVGAAQQMVKSTNLVTKHLYQFERIFGQDSRQSEIYEELSCLLHSVYEGVNVCIFAYGNTGSGKTYTIFGGQKEEEKGLLPRTLANIQNKIAASPELQFSVRYCFSELYNDRLFDLQDDGKVELDSFRMKDLKAEPGELIGRLTALVQEAKKKRTTSRTEMNASSSRSHAFFQFEVSSAEKQATRTIEKRGTVTFIDLAGSEKISEGGSDKARKAEVVFINKSLSSLRDVLAALSKDEAHIPFRNSRLTTLLQDYLANDSKTFVIVNVCSSNKYFHQTKGSLEFAKAIPKIENKFELRRNVTITPKAEHDEDSPSVERVFPAIPRPRLE